MKRILAAIEFSPITDSVVSLAAELARFEQAEIVVLHVLSSTPTITYAALTPEALDAMVRAADEKARQELTRIENWLTQRGIKSQARLVSGDWPIPQILEAAEEVSAAWLVLGSHGHGRVYEVFMGSTALGVARSAPCPVAVVPAATVMRNRTPVEVR